MASLLVSLLATPAFAACSVRTTTAVDLGTYSPAAVRQTVVPYRPASSGFGCSAAILSLLSSDYARATVSAATPLKLTSTTDATRSVTYTLAADSAGANPISPGTAFVFKGPSVNLLGLLGDASDVKVYVRPTSTDPVPPGIYKGDFKITWAWQFCSLLGVNLLGAEICLVNDTSASASNTTATISITLTLTANPVQMVIATTTVWDPQSNTANPRATPGSRQRTTVTVSNPDIATLDANSLRIVLPTPAKGVVALDGDKTPANAVVTTSDGTPASNLALTYTASNSSSDDVEFSNNVNFDLVTEPWTYQPAPGNAAAQAAITAIRFRPRGTMAAGSSFSVSMPYSVSLLGP
ncbi:protein CsuE [Sphingomonas ginsenosidivorax]|uniref:Protein CsuE n=1 Tax=Sphingomonas ginsenosidivorax TaxID=862135 RepID=A0A5C6UGG8_9SPHN|nr:protein CsuE [Sphingomonas ginsenosidivorax]TXC71847.1 protein CsuE [Sphingomonas ginsenosidivorax]